MRRKFLTSISGLEVTLVINFSLRLLEPKSDPVVETAHLFAYGGAITVEKM